MDIVFFKESIHIIRILALSLNITVEPVEMVLKENLKLVFGLWRLCVVFKTAKHVSDLCIRIDFVALNDCLSARHELIVGDLIFHLPISSIRIFGRFRILFVQDDAAACKWICQYVVNLIERQPILNFPLITLKASCRITFESVNRVTAFKTTVCFREMQGRIKMAKRHHWLHAIFMALVKDAIVKCKAFLVRILIITVRENAAPANGHTENFEAHFRYLGKLLLVSMIEINAATLGEIVILRMLLHLFKYLGRNSIMRKRLTLVAAIGLT